ncbi:MAG: transcriptional regulator NrdR [Elusimicrobiota bacterium]|nr:transcriptional regulator NrdR [Elusimicrobiota bacterium]
MKCPFCSSFNGQVLDSRPVDNSSAVKRRRECLDCKKRYTTFERLEEFSMLVVKNAQNREPYNRKKMLEGISLACRKRPISAETIDAVASEVENEIFSEYVLEIPSRIIGDKILERLYDIDPVAYIRFASVYRNFSDIDAFMSEIKKLKKAHKTKRGDS